MIQINKNKTKSKLVFTVSLDSDIELMGLLRPIKQRGLASRTSENEEVLIDNTSITGYTTSKLYLIEQSFPLKRVVYNEEVTIRGTNLKGAVTGNTEEYTGYYLGVDENVRINYMDIGEETIFNFIQTNTITHSEDDTFLLEYFELIDEPKLESTLFIDRGINNVFESFRRLRTVDNIQELKQTGFGYFFLKDSGII